MFPVSDIWWNHKNPFPPCLIHFHVSSLTGLGALDLGSHHPRAHVSGVLGDRRCLGTGQARGVGLCYRKRDGKAKGKCEGRSSPRGMPTAAFGSPQRARGSRSQCLGLSPVSSPQLISWSLSVYETRIIKMPTHTVKRLNGVMHEDSCACAQLTVRTQGTLPCERVNVTRQQTCVQF